MIMFLGKLGFLCMYLYLLRWIFYGYEDFFLPFFSLIIYWIPNSIKINYRREYEFIDERNVFNPLYVRGYFRKHIKDKTIFASLKGLYYCQIISGILGVSCLIYVFCNRLFHLKTRIRMFEDIIIWGILILFLLWLLIKLFYIKCYEKDFCYSENDNNTWMPFRYIARPPQWGFYRPFHCRYRIPYENLKEKLFEESQQKGYRHTAYYKLNPDEEINVFIREKDRELDIFEIIHIKEFSEEYFDRCNDVFVEVWEKHIKGRYKFKLAGVTFLLCVDIRNEALKKRLLSLYSVAQKKDRYRLPAILVLSENYTFDILANYRFSNSKDNKYNRMRKALLNMMGISERYDGKTYPEEVNENI